MQLCLNQRHNLVFIAEQAEFTLISCHNNASELQYLVKNWLAADLPCIYTRQTSTLEGTIHVGLPVIEKQQKQRIALQIPQVAIKRQQALPTLFELQDFFATNYEIAHLNKYEHLNYVAVYGSFLFEYLSGYSFVTPQSDLDLLIHYPMCSLQCLQDLISELTAVINRKIDGEIRFPHWGDVAFQELFDLTAPQLLFKTANTVTLHARSLLYDYYPSLSVNH